MTKRTLTLSLFLYAALAGACGGDRVVSQSPVVQKSVLARIEVTADTLLMPGDYRKLTINAWDQFGAELLDDTGNDWRGKAKYVSSDSEIARVSAGWVSAVAPGAARITVSLTIGDSTLTSSVSARVGAPTDTSVVVTLDQNGLSWSPVAVNLKAPATVTWVVPAGVQAPTIWLNVWADNPEKLEFIDGVVTRKLSTPGDYYYGTGGGLNYDEQGGVVRVF